MIKAILISLVSGGVATSLAEYFLNYNLIDLLKDKVLALFGKAKAEEQKAVTEIKRKF
ncbi:MAG TPA: hypothetical protein VHV32_19450 [Candidatus Angelobacter sp.]|jgi:hypothetical protein|nr:hypothetical protein [Candidatus Angelobacter sp.]